MKPLILLLLSHLIFSHSITAQTLTGKVIDTKNQPIGFANVALYALPDSVLVTGTITDEKGDFVLDTKSKTNGFLKISFIGYESQIISMKSGQTIILKDDSHLLGEVVVKGNLPKIQMKNDALVANVQNTVLSKAGTGNDVLKRIPLITGDKGEFSVFGKGEAKIYINNREMRDATELENLNSSNIKNVEVVTNPGARYDASVKAVIRITTVKKVGDGFGFDVRSSYYQSQNIDLIEQLNANYRKKGWDIFGTIKFNRNNWFQDSKMWQETYVDTLWTQENKMYASGSGNTITAIGGVNYEISPKHSIGVKYSIDMFPQSYKYGTLTSTVFADDIFYDKWSNEETTIMSPKPTHLVNIYYNVNFNKLGINFNNDYYTSQLHTQTNFIEKSEQFDNRTITSENSVFNRLFASKLVLSYPVLGGDFSFGGEYTNTHREDEYINMEKLVPSSNTTINEQNSSLFMEYSHNTPIGQIGAGLRYENVNTEYLNDGKRNEEQSRKYQQWFPNLSFSTKIKDVGIQLSYTAKTKRPSYKQLSSNVFYGNRFLLQTGNPFLKPSTIHGISFVSSWKFLQLILGYNDERNAIIYWTTQDKNKPAISIISHKNLEHLPSLNAYTVISPTFGIWSPQITAGIIKQWLTIESAGRQIKLEKPLFVFSFKNSLRLPKNYLLTLDADYTGSGEVQNIRLVKNTWVINAALNKSFFDDRLNIDLKVSDIFYQKRDGNLLYNAQMEYYQMNKFDSREIELTLRYKFNSVKSKYKGTGAGKDEIKRL